MKIFNFSVTEVASLLTMLTIVVGSVGWFTKVVIINPLRVDMRELNGNLKRLNKDLISLQDENKSINQVIAFLRQEVDKKGVRFEEQIKQLSDRIDNLEDS